MKRASFLLVLTVVSHFFAYSDSSWLQAETQNFTFIYQKSETRAVEELLTFAEDVYEELTSLLGTTTPRVTVVLYGQTDFANGYYNPNPPQHIGLYTVQPSGPWIGAGTESWLHFLFVHELTHFIQANHRPGLFYGLGSVFGRQISGLDIGFVPLWVTEGLAIHTESLLTSGGRQSDPLFELYYRALAIEDDLFSLRQAGYSSHLAPQGGRSYVAGAFIWRELEARFGPEFAARFLDEYTPFPLFGMWRAVRATTDRRMTTIYESITNQLVREYAEQARQPVDKQISPDVEANYALPVATEAGLITYRFRPDERTGFVLLTESAGGEDELFAAPASDRDSWDAPADGSTIVFATPTAESRSGLGSEAKSDLFLFDRESGTTERLTNGGGYFAPAIDRSSRYIVATERIGNYQRLVSFDSRAEDIEPRVLLHTPMSRFYYPDISPDGTMVLAAINQEGLQQIILLTGPSDPSPGEVMGYVPIIDGAAPYKPLFEGSSAVTFSAYVDGALSLFRYDLETGTMTRIATDRVGVIGGFIDGDRVVYQAYTSDGFVVRQGPIEAAGITPERFSQLPFQIEMPETEARAPVEAIPYRAVPLPRFWLPWLTIREPADQETAIGIGAIVTGADYLGRNAWQSELYYFPSFNRSGYGLAYNWQADRYRVQVALREEYLGNVGSEAAPIYLQRFENALRFQVDLLSTYKLGITNRLTLGLTLDHIADAVAPVPFQLYESAGEATQFGGGLLAPGVTLSFARARQKPLDAAVAPGGFGLSGQTISPLSLPGFADQDFLFGVSGYTNLPLGGSHVLRVAPSTRFSTSTVFRNPFSLRGFSADVSPSDSTTAFYHLSLDYLPPRFLVDVPLFSSVGITQIGFGAFAETAGGIASDPVTLTPASTFVAGLESTIVVTYLLDWPLTFGVALRVNAEDPASFSADDFSFYLDIDLNESIGTIGDYLER